MPAPTFEDVAVIWLERGAVAGARQPLTGRAEEIMIGGRALGWGLNKS